MMWVENSSLLDECVLLWLCLKNMFGEWCSWDMIMCLVLLMMKELVVVIRGSLFMQIFCFFIFLMIGLVGDFLFRIIRCILVCSGDVKVRLCCWYFLMLNGGVFSIYDRNLRCVKLLCDMMGKIEVKVDCRFLFLCFDVVCLGCRKF